MSKLRLKTSLLVGAAAATGLVLGAGIALAAHVPIQLKTYEEVGRQFGMPTGGPAIQLDANGQGMPYSPKQTCGTDAGASCHNYSAVADHAFHGELGVKQWKDSTTISGSPIAGGTFATTTQTRQKPWTQSAAMWGKW